MFDNFSDRMYVLRRLRKVNANEVAYAIGVTPGTVSAWEMGRTFPQGRQLLQISKTYDCTINWLVGEEPLDSIKGANK